MWVCCLRADHISFIYFAWQTLFLAVNYLDRYISKQPVDRRKFQLVGVTCMFIAAKYEGVYAPAVDEFVYISANTYSREEVRS